MKKRFLLTFLLLALPIGLFAATETLRPDGAGSEANMSPSAGSNWQNVDEATSDNDGTYNATSSTSYERDIYSITDHSAGSGTINNVTVHMMIRSTNNGKKVSGKTVLRTSASNYEGAVQSAVPTTYTEYTTVYNNDPSDSNPWTWAEVDALQAGATIQQSGNGKPGRVTQVWIVVDYTASSDVIWGGGTGPQTSDWHTGTNWTGDAVPGNTQTALFDGTSTVDCNLTSGDQVAGITFLSAYVGTFNFSSSTLQVTGDANFSGVGNVTAGTGKLQFNGTGTQQTFTPKAFQDFPQIEQNGSAGTIIVVNNLQADDLIVTSGTLNLGASLNHTAVDVSGAGTLDFNTADLNVSGTTINFGSMAGVSQTSGATLVFARTSGTQTFTPKSGATFPPIVHNAGATLLLASNALTCEGFTQSAGILDFANLNVTTTNLGDFTVTNGTASTFSNHDGITITIAGEGDFYGTSSATKLNMNPTPGWYIASTGALEATYVTMRNCTATVTAGIGYSSTNSGLNDNWSFTTPTYWGGGSGPQTSAWGTGTNWTGDTPPGALNDVIFDGTSDVDCNLAGSPTVPSVTFTSGYNGTFNFSTDNLTLTKQADFQVGSGGSITGTGTLTLSGSGLQTVTPPAAGRGSLPDITKSGSGSVLVSTNALDADDLSVSAGNWDWGDGGKTHTVESITATGGSMDIGNSVLQVSVGNANLNGFTSITGSSGSISLTGTSGTQVLTPSPASGSNTETIRPSGAGNSTNLTPSAGANWQTVDEATSDDDATYVEHNSTTETQDSYAMSNSTGSGTITSVTVYVRVRVEQVGKPVTVKTVLRTGGTDYLSAGTSHNSTSYGNVSQQYNNNPNTGSAWSWTEVDALEAGVALDCSQAGKYGRCTQVWVEVAYTVANYYPPISKTGAATLQLATNDLTCGGFTMSAGVLDFNGRDITTQSNGNFTITDGGTGTFSGNTLGGRTITVAGNASFSGTGSGQLNMDPTSTWYINATGALTATYADINNSDAQGGSNGSASNSCTNGGTNWNWTFNVLAPVWSRTGVGAVSGGAITESDLYLGTGVTGTKALQALGLSDGANDWSYPTSSACNTPSTFYSGGTYTVFASAGNFLVGVQDDGAGYTELFSPVNLTATAGNPYTSPDHSSVYIAYTGNLTKRNMSDGTAVWTVGVTNISTAADPIVDKDWVYIATTDGYVRKGDSFDFTPLTSYYMGSSTAINMPLLMSNDIIYVSPNNATLHAVNTAGMTAYWSGSFGLRGTNSGAAYKDESSSKIYLAAGQYVQKITDNGSGSAASEDWFDDAGATVQSGPIPFDGTVYYGRNSSRYYAVTDAGGVDETNWPYLSVSGNATSGPWIDITNNRVIYGSDAGDVDAFAKE